MGSSLASVASGSGRIDRRQPTAPQTAEQEGAAVGEPPRRLVTAPKSAPAPGRMRPFSTPLQPRHSTPAPRPLARSCWLVVPMLFHTSSIQVPYQLHTSSIQFPLFPAPVPPAPLRSHLPHPTPYRCSHATSGYTFSLRLQPQLVPLPGPAAAAFRQRCPHAPEHRTGPQSGLLLRAGFLSCPASVPGFPADRAAFGRRAVRRQAGHLSIRANLNLRSGASLSST